VRPASEVADNAFTAAIGEASDHGLDPGDRTPTQIIQDDRKALMEEVRVIARNFNYRTADSDEFIEALDGILEEKP